MPGTPLPRPASGVPSAAVMPEPPVPTTVSSYSRCNGRKGRPWGFGVSVTVFCAGSYTAEAIATGTQAAAVEQGDEAVVGRQLGPRRVERPVEGQDQGCGLVVEADRSRPVTLGASAAGLTASRTDSDTLLSGLGSPVPEAVIAATLKAGPGEVARTVRTSVATPPAGTVPTVQRPVAASRTRGWVRR